MQVWIAGWLVQGTVPTQYHYAGELKPKGDSAKPVHATRCKQTVRAAKAKAKRKKVHAPKKDQMNKPQPSKSMRHACCVTTPESFYLPCVDRIKAKDVLEP